MECINGNLGGCERIGEDKEQDAKELYLGGAVSRKKK